MGGTACPGFEMKFFGNGVAEIRPIIIRIGQVGDDRDFILYAF
jgi:hypothetical protein